MKIIILLIVTFIFIKINAQTRPANIEIPITVFDNSGMPNNSRVLTCGIDTMATDSIDSFLGEYWQICPWDLQEIGSDCPPVDHFEAVFDIPVEPDPNSFEFGSWKDFRQGTIPYYGTKTYGINYWTYGAATALFVSWNFPEGVTGLLQDVFGGYFFSYQMPDSGTFTHPSLIQLQGSNWGALLVLTYQNTVPIELISFNATLLDNTVNLNWTTATETNNSGFGVERLQDSKIERLKDRETIGFVPGFGTTTEPKSYSFVDQNVTSGTYKYRLKQIDFDGSFTYSNEIEVEVDITPKEFVLYQNYPNPFNPSTTIKFEIPDAENTRRIVFTTLKVYDILGNEVATLVNEEKQPGVYEVEFSVGQDSSPDIASGIYFYQLKAGSFNQTKKMILLR